MISFPGAEESVTNLTNSIWLYRMFDIAEEINLTKVEEILAGQKPTSRLKLARVKPKSIHIENPPVTVDIGERRIMLCFGLFKAAVLARVYNLGVIGLILRIELPAEMGYEEIKDLAIYLNGTDELEPLFEELLSTLQKNLIPATSMPVRSNFAEDFTIFFFRRWRPEWDPVPLLLSENEVVSRQVREDTLKHSFSYGSKDLTIITWDAALVYDEEGSTDIPDLLEFAITQLLELRYYDNLLSGELNRMYDALELADKEGWYSRLKKYRQIMKKMMELVVDVTEIMDKIENSFKVTEDVFYARVYGAALASFRTQAWMDSIQQKISVIQRSYSMLSDEIINHRSTLMELAIIILFLLEIILGLSRLL